jgi:hypothetical protein
MPLTVNPASLDKPIELKDLSDSEARQPKTEVTLG